jgi:hypothetical protein
MNLFENLSFFVLCLAGAYLGILLLDEGGIHLAIGIAFITVFIRIVIISILCRFGKWTKKS